MGGAGARREEEGAFLSLHSIQIEKDDSKKVTVPALSTHPHILKYKFRNKLENLNVRVQSRKKNSSHPREEDYW